MELQPDRGAQAPCAPQARRPGGNQAAPEASPFLVSAPKIELPKGGGAIRGMGEKFAANPVTGTGSMSVPIPASAGRAGFGPRLAVSYDSGAGNGPFGLGWSVSLPAISRKTDKGLPRYLRDDEFLLSGAEDLVPVLVQIERDGRVRWEPQVLHHSLYTRRYAVQLFRPRVEGLFARIECWTNTEDGTDVFWRTLSRDNITTWYGTSAESRIADPGDRTRIYSWLVSESHDDKGNLMVYAYKAEDSEGVDPAAINELNRTLAGRSANRYLKRIRYGNTEAYVPTLLADSPAPLPSGWLFELVFDYGEHDEQAPEPRESRPWLRRADPFSTCRAGFEIRSYRLCRRALMFHHFPDDPAVGADCLVRATHFAYREPAGEHEPGEHSPGEPGYTTLASIEQHGFQRRAAGGYLSRQLPPLGFTYSVPRVDGTPRSIDPAERENLPVGILGPGYQWIDLDGEGLPGVLSAQGGAWHYKPNLGEGRFGPTTVIHEQPALASSAQAAQLMDLEGDGVPELVSLRTMPTGFHARDSQGAWRGFVPFASLPDIDWEDPDLRFLDLTGDGHADALLTEDDAFTWYPSQARLGYGAAERTPWALDEEQGPRLVFADGTQTIFLADMSGDGLTDLVRIRNGNACYWPNIGYGRFGAKVSLGNPPRFDSDDLYDPRRIRLADIDGSGPADLIYLGRDGASLYFNRSGNSLSNASPIDLPVATENLGAVQVADLFGNGTACLVWNSHLPGDASGPVRYIDLMGGAPESPDEHRGQGKPHLLIGVDNNLGGSTRIEYTPSTRFYIADKLAGMPWVTRLPFPVHCVSRVTVHDRWRGSAFSSSFSYHHGYFDGAEREFRGFGRVEQVDAEEYARFAQDNRGSPWITDDWRLFQAPVKTVTWFHTGLAEDRARALSQFANEYFPARHPPSGDFQERQLPEPLIEAAFDPTFHETLDDEEWREAMRACKGMMLRQETYELDPRALAEVPPRHVPTRLHGAASHNCRIRCLQPRAGNRHAVYHATESETLTYQYELALPAAGPPGNPDPRIAHSMNLRVDELGNKLQAIAIGYPRTGQFDVAMLGDPMLTEASFDARTLRTIRAVQAETHIAYIETRYTDDLELPARAEGDPLRHRRLRLPCEVRTYELANIAASAGRYYAVADFTALGLSERYSPELAPIASLQYQRRPQPGGPPQRREVQAVCSLYFDDSDEVAQPVAPLPLGRHGPRGMKYEDYKLALSDELLAAVFQPWIDGAQTDLLGWSMSGGGPTARDVLHDAARSGYLRGGELAERFGLPAAAMAGQYWLRSGIAGFAGRADEHYYLPRSYTNPFNAATTLLYDEHDLYIAASVDALGNRTAVTRFDHRALVPLELEDPNGNRTEACIDVLDRVVAVAVKGKRRADAWEGDDLTGFDAPDRVNPAAAEVQAFSTATTFDEPRARDWLQRAGTRFVYHFGEARDAAGAVVRWADRPAMACAIVRERHAPATGTDDSPLQVTLECADGRGAVMMNKRQAEPAGGGVALRWIVNGLTVLNNKGKPVKQYEPFFSDDFGCQMPEEHGVTPLLYYDAAGRLLRTEMPDGTLSRTEFTPWHQRSFDAGDTVLEGPWYRDHDPLHPVESPLPIDAAGRVTAAPEVRARWLSAQYADTPGLTVFDSLGREVLAISHQRVPDPEGPYNFGGQRFRDALYGTFTRLDAEGKPLWIRDARNEYRADRAARGNLVMQYIVPPRPNDDPGETLPAECAPAYDIAGNLLYQHSMDGGDRWMLSDAAGQSLLAWDLNDRQAEDGSLVLERRLASTEYDALHRPVARWMRFDSGEPAMTERLVYRNMTDPEGAEAARHNLIGETVRHYDPSGLVEVLHCDFKGNIQHEQRRLNNRPRDAVIDWQGEPERLLELETFARITEHDALGRMTRLFNWHRGIGTRVAVYEPHYNARGLLDSEDIVVGATKTVESYEPYEPPRPDSLPRRPAGRTTAVGRVTCNARGQRERIEYGNGTFTEYEYDLRSFRLVRLGTTRMEDGAALQNLRYTYDAAGNIVAIRDDAQQTVYFMNAVVEPHCEYAYDALYRLVSARGREHAAQNNVQRDGRDFEPVVGIPFPNSPEALQTYVESYEYDPAGNILRMRHVGGRVERWTRRYQYAQDSNRLTGTSLPGDDPDVYSARYRHDLHGSMLNLANVSPPRFIRWDYRDMVHSLDRMGGGWAYYNYDAGKQRRRKRLEHVGETVEERLYLGSVEIYRSFNAEAEVLAETETHHLFVDDQRVLLIEDVLAAKDGELPPGSLYRYQYGNHLGSAGLEAGERGRTISFEESHPYGGTAFLGLGNEVRAAGKRYRYTGTERDEESGLGYHGARHYASHLAKWISCDPCGIQDGLNRYSYVLDNPLTRVDRGGRQGEPAGPRERRVLALGRATLDMEGGRERRYPAGLIRDAQRDVAGTAIVITDLGPPPDVPGQTRSTFWELFEARPPLPDRWQGLASSVPVQEALEGLHGITDVWFDTRQVDMTRVGTGSQTSSELRSVVAALASGTPVQVDVHFRHEGGLSTIARGSDIVEGAPLPDNLVRHLGPRFTNAPRSGPMGGGSPGGEGSSALPERSGTAATTTAARPGTSSASGSASSSAPTVHPPASPVATATAVHEATTVPVATARTGLRRGIGAVTRRAVDVATHPAVDALMMPFTVANDDDAAQIVLAPIAVLAEVVAWYAEGFAGILQSWAPEEVMRSYSAP